MWTVYSERLFQTQGTWAYVCGWGKASPSMPKSLGLKGLMVGAGGEGPGVPQVSWRAFLQQAHLCQVPGLEESC